MAHGASALTTVDYKTTLIKQGQFHGVATETDTLYNTLTIIRNNKMDLLRVASIDKLCISLSVKTKKTFQLLSLELLMYVLCENRASRVTMTPVKKCPKIICTS